MKIISKYINSKNSTGSVKVQCEDEEDMYQLYNLLCSGDELEALTVRNIHTCDRTNAANKSKNRIQTKICIRIEAIEYDDNQCSLRIKGVNIKENEYIKLGQYHTLDCELNRTFEITKEIWDPIHLELLDDLSDPAKKAEVAALVLHEGLAHLCLLKSSLTKTCAKIERTFPKRKTINNQEYNECLMKFFDDIYSSILKYVDFEIVKVILVGSPGFLNNDFLKFMNEKSMRLNDIQIIKNKSKFLKGNTSSGHKRAIDEMMNSQEFLAQLGNVKAVEEVKMLQLFHDMLATDPDRACYGTNHVIKASEQLAISDLLISDQIYRTPNIQLRKEYINLMESVKNNGGKVFKFSSMHTSGSQLNLYTGIAAILRFPIPDDEEVLSDTSSDEDYRSIKAVKTSMNCEHDISAYI